jgi:hypothetical protein
MRNWAFKLVDSFHFIEIYITPYCVQISNEKSAIMFEELLDLNLVFLRIFCNQIVLYLTKCHSIHWSKLLFFFKPNELQFRCIYLLCHIYRVEYDPDQYLWEKEFILAGREYQRKDLEASMDIFWMILLSIFGSYLVITTFNSLFIFFPFLNKTLQLKNARGYTLQCSHYLPSSVPEDISLPCVIYCHGNRYFIFCRHCYPFSLESIWFGIIIISTLGYYIFRIIHQFYFSVDWYVCIYVQLCSGCRADANEAAVILLPSNITVFTLDFSGSGLSDGDHVSLGWHEVRY